MRVTLTLTMSFLFFFGQSQTTLPYPLIDSLGKTAQIDFSQYKGIKLLLVNVDPSDSSFNQYNELISLSARISGCKVVVFPSENSPADATQLYRLYHNAVKSANLIIANPQSVNGSKANSIYKWLSNQTSNGQVNLNCTKPFYKVLISREGTLEAVFGPKMKCTDTNLLIAINK